MLHVSSEKQHGQIRVKRERGAEGLDVPFFRVYYTEINFKFHQISEIFATYLMHKISRIIFLFSLFIRKVRQIYFHTFFYYSLYDESLGNLDQSVFAPR